MQFLGYEAYVSIDGVELPAYEIKADETGKTVTCWIASEAGKSFAINWKPLWPRTFDICGDIFIDGESMSGQLHRKNAIFLASVNDRITSPTTSRPLTFAPIELTDDDRYLHSQTAKSLGDITLVLSEAESGEEVAPKTVELNHDKVHERANDVLRADGIAPPDPTALANKRKASETIGSDDDVEEDNGGVEEDEAELKAQLRLIQEKLAKKGKSKRKKVKVEGPTKRSLLVHGEVIDLT
ncbi:hypothetical protein H0H81_000371 [Sphagnurus paluster]|uniref:DUF7918 domain-containing protein n=1 Tax=Sphagnurus paluster TaxID=117069 RepID=A0A9P7FT63_9AGAR|nr:hypothetical protein H0H81_000371 [Sphagnurus paluster]